MMLNCVTLGLMLTLVRNRWRDAFSQLDRTERETVADGPDLTRSQEDFLPNLCERLRVKDHSATGP